MATRHTKLFLEGRNDELVIGLRDRMTEAAVAECFEQAAQLRDAIRTIVTLQTRQQKMASAELGDRDAFGLKLGPAGAVVQIFHVRGGRVIERNELVTEIGDFAGASRPDAPHAATSEAEVLEAALQQFYADRVPAPEIHLPHELSESDTDVLEGWLSARAGRRVRLMVPRRGEKRGLLELAARNAEVAYQTRFNENVAAHYDALETLRVVLALASVPRRIECFDISTIQGSETVASMVVCEDGRMKRSEYRKFRIRGSTLALPRDRSGSRDAAAGGAEGVPTPIAGGREAVGDAAAPAALNNDFASMHEVLLRRYRKLLEMGGAFPDLILIDGGKGQLSAAYAALEELGLGSLVAAGIAKKEELLFTRDRTDPIALAQESPALLLIQRIRDEAHRFAVTFHRQSRSTRDLRSAVDAISGVGPRRRKALLTAFGSVAGVRRATREELVRIVGTKCADAVLSHFAAQN